MGDLAAVIPLDADAILVVRIADYHAGRFPPAQAHSGAKEGRKFPKGDFDRFRNAVLNGKPPAMPPWRDKVGDDDVKLLWAYVRSGG